MEKEVINSPTSSVMEKQSELEMNSGNKNFKKKNQTLMGF